MFVAKQTCSYDEGIHVNICFAWRIALLNCHLQLLILRKKGTLCRCPKWSGRFERKKIKNEMSTIFECLVNKFTLGIQFAKMILGHAVSRENN